MKHKIGIMADSSSRISTKDLEEMNIGFCPLLITFTDNNNNHVTIEDTPTLDEKKFYHTLQTTNVKTSQTPIGKMSEIWTEQLTKFEQIIFIPLSKGLSGQYNTAMMLAKEPNFKNKVFVFDSDGVSIINWLLVKMAYQMTQVATNDVETIIASLETIKKNYLAFIVPFDLKYLARGGRISKTAAALANIVQLKPILSFDGTIDKFNTTRTWKKAIITTLKEINKKKKIENITLFYIIHAFANAEQIKEVETYVKNYGIKNAKIISLANVICAHTGIGTFSFVAFDLEKSKLPKLT